MADITFTNNPEMDNPELHQAVEKENKLKELLVDYVGEKHNPEDGNVTVDLIVATLLEEFPEFMEAIAVENWIRGYQQAMADVEDGREFLENKLEKQADEDEG